MKAPTSLRRQFNRIWDNLFLFYGDGIRALRSLVNADSASGKPIRTQVQLEALETRLMPAFSITGPASLPNDDVHHLYTANTITTSGGVSPISFSIYSGTFPPGLTLNGSTGGISGTPTSASSVPYSFTIEAEDSSRDITSKGYSVTINYTPSIVPTTLPNATVSQSYSSTISEALYTGTAPETYGVSSGSLPSGLNLSSSGALTGIPTAAGSYSFTVTSTDAVGVAASQSYTVDTAPTVTSNATSIADSGTSITIKGVGFSTTTTNDAVTFNLGVVGSVTAATSTQLIVAITTPPTALGSLTAVATINAISSGPAVQVATEINGIWTVTDNNGSGTSGGMTDMTLPYAVKHALSGDTITFASALSSNTITLNATLTVNSNVVITGMAASNLAVSGNSSVEDFRISSGYAVDIASLTIVNGKAASGGGIQNAGTLTLSGVTLTGNKATSSGGAIDNVGTLTLSNDTVYENTASRKGGGIKNSGSLTISNSTISANSAATGGGIASTGALTLLSSIVAGDSAGSSCPDVLGVATIDYDQIGTTAGLSYSGGTGNILGNSSGLASGLANNGGPTQTLALLPGSAAMGTGGALTNIATGHAVGTTDTTIYVGNAAVIASTPGQYEILIDDEEMLVTSVDLSTDTLTVERGYNNTTATTHAVGADVYLATDQRGVPHPTNSPDIGASQSDDNPLSLTNPGTQTVSEGDSVSLSITSSPGSGLTFSDMGLPAGLTYNPTTGEITGTIALGDASSGPYTTVVTASYGSYSASMAFGWDISTPLSWNTMLGNQSDPDGTTIAGLTTGATDTISGTTQTFGAVGLPPGLAIDTSTGTISGTIAAGADVNSPYTVTLLVQDNALFSGDGGYSISQTFTWTVTNPITIDQVLNQTTVEGTSVSLSITAVDATSGKTMVFTADGLPNGLAIDTSTGEITGTVAAGTSENGPFTVTVNANDGTSQGSMTFGWAINSPVVIAVPPAQINDEGDTPSLTISATDLTSGSITYGVIGLPAGLTFNTSTRVISGTVSTGDSADSPYTVTLLATDGTYTDVETFPWTININTPVTVNDPGDQDNSSGVSFSMTMTGSDTGGSIGTWSATGLPTGLSINSSTGVISGTPTTGGDWTTTITAGDGSHTGSDTFDWEIDGPISITDSGEQYNNSGDAVSVPITGDDSDGTIGTWSATGLPGGLAIDSSTGTISGTISAAAGNYTATVTATDGTNTSVDSFAWVIYPTSDLSITTPSTQNSTEGTAIISLNIDHLTSATYIGPYTFAFAASNLPAGLVIVPATGVISGTPAAGDGFYSPYSVQVTVTDGDYFDTQTFTWNVVSPITVGTVSDQTTTEGTTIGTLTITATDSVSGASSPVFSAFGLPAGLHINPTSGDINGTVAPGDFAYSPYIVTVVAASGSYVGSGSFNWTINSPISIGTIGSQSSTENSAIGTVSPSATDSVSGATLTWSATGLPPGLKINATNGEITGTPSLGSAQLGPYAVTVIAEDGTYSGVQNFTWTITCPITVTQPTDQTNNEGDTVSVSIAGSDSVSGASMTYGAIGLPAGLIINPTTGVISGKVAAGDAATGSGSYSVNVNVSDGTYNNSVSFSWSVNPAINFNVNTPSDPTNNVGDTVSVSAAATDAISGATVTYSATSLPTGLTLSSVTGAITGTLTNSGYWQAEVTATDGTYTDSTEIDWSVNGAISITDQGDQTNSIGDVLSTSGSTPTAVDITATDTASGSYTFSATGLPPGLTIDSGSGTITGTVSSSASITTPYTTTITVTDGSNTGVDVFTWYVNPAGPIVITNPGNVANSAGDDVEMQMEASDSSDGTLMYSAINLPGGLYINPYNGYINGTISSGDVSGSPYSVTIIASDGPNTAATTFPWTISAATGTISSSNPGGQTSNEGASISSVSIDASDSLSGSTLYYTAFGLPPGLRINTGTGAITGTVAIGANYEGPYSVTVEASDGTSYITQTFDWNVFSPITVDQVSDQTNTEDDSVSVDIVAADSISGATMSYVAEGLPPGLKINPSTGVVSGTVAANASAMGSYEVTVIAQDGTYTSQMSYNWTINSPVIFDAVADQANNENDSVDLSTGATDALGTVVWSAVGLPGGLVINSSTGVISGTVAVGDSNIGYFSPTIIANDGTYYNTETVNWFVNSPIQFNDPGDQVNAVGDVVDLPVTATDASSGTLVYAAEGLPAGLAINLSTGVISGTIASGALTIGTYETTVFASDGTYSSSDTFDWTITAAGAVTLATPSNQSGTEGTGITSWSLSASDTTSGATVHYFAEGLPPGIVLSAGGTISGTLAVGDGVYSPYDVTVIATDGSNFAQESFTWTVADPLTFSAVAGNLSNSEGDTPTPSFATSSGSPVYTAIGLPTGLSIGKTSGTISGTVAAGDAAVGSYLVVVTANDGTYSASETFTWTIGSPISFTAPVSLSGTEGASGAQSAPTTTDTNTRATVTYTAIGLPQGLSVDPSTGAIEGTVAVGDSETGTYNYTLVANDGTSSTAQSETWTVGSPITILGVSEQSFNTSGPISLQMQTSYSGSGTLSYSATGLPAGLTISASTGLISGTLDADAEYRGTIDATVVVTDGTYRTTATVDLTTLGDPETVELVGTAKRDESEQLWKQRKAKEIAAAKAAGDVVVYFANPRAIGVDIKVGNVTEHHVFVMGEDLILPKKLILTEKGTGYVFFTDSGYKQAKALLDVAAAHNGVRVKSELNGDLVVTTQDDTILRLYKEGTTGLVSVTRGRESYWLVFRKPYFLLNDTQGTAIPVPRGRGPNDGRLESHHTLQKQWAIENLKKKGIPYNEYAAPSITIERGRDAKGNDLPHEIITKLQTKRRQDRLAAGKGAWSSTIDDELGYIVDDLTAAGFDKQTIIRVLEANYIYLDRLGVKYTPVPGF